MLSSSSTPDPPPPPLLLIDRVVTATTLAGCVQGLLGLQEALRQGVVLDHPGVDASASASHPHDSADNALLQLYDALISILRGSHAAVQSATQRDEVWQATLKLYDSIATATPSSSSSSTQRQLYEHWFGLTRSKADFMAALVDVATATNTTQAYTRVLAVQQIVKAAQVAPQATQSALLATPQALHRLSDVLTSAQEDEQVQLVVLQQLAPLLAAWPAAAKVWVFAEVPQLMLRYAVVQQGGWTNGNVIVKDALQLIDKLLSHEATAVVLVTQSDPQWWTLLTRLLDLRQAHSYKRGCDDRHGGDRHGDDRHGNDNAVGDDLDDIDDLDDLLQGNIGATKPSSSSSKLSSPPTTTKREEDVLLLVLRLLRTLLIHNAVRATVPSALWHYLWDWACLGPPPPNNQPPPCAWTSIHLQVQVLQLIAEFGTTHGENADHLLWGAEWHAWDRLLYLICTGGPGRTLDEQTRISQAAVAVLRACLHHRTTPDTQDLLLAALAPPPPLMEDEQLRMQATAVPRLLQTVVEYLQHNNNNNNDDNDSAHVVGLTGALSALAFLTGSTEAQKSLLYKLATPTLVHDLWQRMAVEWERYQQLADHTSETDVLTSQYAQTVMLSIWRFVGTWMAGAPLVGQAVLQHAQATVLWSAMVQPRASMHRSQHSIAADCLPTVASLVLGVALADMSPRDENETADWGGWTPQAILDVLGNLTARLLAWKQLGEATAEEISKHQKDTELLLQYLPWMVNAAERQAWQTWYTAQVWQVRKALIYTVAGSSPSVAVENNDQPLLPALVTQQAEELDELRRKLQAAQTQVQRQDKQLTVWKKRVESTPTELDEMLTEYGSQTQALEETVDQLRNDLQVRDETIRTLESRVNQVESSQQEVTEERDRMQDELKALGEAYANLEEEYRRLEQTNQQQQQQQQQLQQPTTAAGQPATEQAQGENPDQAASMPSATGSVEVATLRAENARLRESAQQADDWMRMAVDRMGAQDARLAQAQQRIGELEAHLQQTSTTPTTAASPAWHEREAELVQSLQNEQAARAELEQALEQTRNQVAVLKQEVALMQSQRDDLEREDTKTIDALVSRGQAAQQAAHAELSAAQESLSEEVAKLRQANQEAQEWMAQAVEHHNALSEQCAALMEENESLKMQSHGPSDEVSASKEVKELSERLAEAQGQLEDKENEMSTLVTKSAKYEAQLREKDGVIAQLTSRLESLQTSTSVADDDDDDESSSPSQRTDLASLQAENERLRAEKEASERRAADAELESEQMKSELAVLSHEYEDLQEEMESLRGQTTSTTLPTNVDELENKLALAVQEREKMANENQRLSEDWQRKYAELQQELASHQIHSKDEDASLQKIEQLEATITELQEELVHRNEEAQAVVSQWEESYNDLQEKYQALGDDAALRAELEDLKAQLQKETEDADHAVAQWQAAYTALEEKYQQLSSPTRDENEENDSIASDSVKKLQAEILSLQQQLEEESAEAKNVVAQWEASYEELQQELEQLKSEAPHSPNIVENSEIVDELKQQIASLKNQLEEESAQAEAAIDQWQASYNEVCQALQEQNKAATEQTDISVSSLQAEIAQLKEQLANDAAEADSAIHQWQESYDALQEELESLKEQASGAEDVERLRSELETAYALVDEWKSRSEALGLELETIRDAREDPSMNELQEDIDNEADDIVASLQTEIETLKHQIETEHQEADDAIAQWQESYQYISGEREKLAAENVALQEKIELLTKDKTDRDENDGNKAVAVLQATVDDLTSQLREKTKEAQEADAQWETSFRALDESRQALEREFETVRDLASALQSELDGKKMESLALQESLETMQSSVEKTAAENAALQEETQTAVSEIARLRAELEQSTQKLTKWEESYQSLEERYNRVSEEYSSLQASADSLREENAKLTASQESSSSQNPLADEVEDLRAQLAQLETQRDAESREADDAISQWQEAYESMEQELEELRKEKTELLEENDQLQNRIATPRSEDPGEMTRLRDSITSLTEERDQAQNRLAALETNVAELQEQLEHALSRAKQAEDELTMAQDSVVSALANEEEERRQEIIDDLQLRISLLEGQLAEEKLLREQSEQELDESEEIVEAWKSKYGESVRVWACVCLEPRLCIAVFRYSLDSLALNVLLLCDFCSTRPCRRTGEY